MKDKHMTFPNRNVTELSNQENLHMILYIYIPHQWNDLWQFMKINCPLDSKEINKEINTIFVGRTDAEAEAPTLWPPDVKSWLIRKDPDPGKDWRQEEKRTIENEIVGWHHRLNGHEFGQTVGDSEGQGSLECYSPWYCKESGMIKWLKNSNPLCKYIYIL